MVRRIGILEFDEPATSDHRKILHVDMDAFYASIEQRDDPKLRGKPVIIARHPRENSGRGVVSTASYEARKYGVHSAMSAEEAYRLCPNGIFVDSRHDYYRQVSEQVRDIFRRFTDRIEPLSIDEAFLDVTANKPHLRSALEIARRLQAMIADELHLTCSIGVSYNKFIAKLASDHHKPHGITMVTPKNAVEFIDQLPIKEIYGIGKRSCERLAKDGIETGKDLRTLSQEECLKYFGKSGLAIYERVRGVDNRSVRTTRKRQSIGNETTLWPYLYSEEDVSETLRRLAHSVAKHVAEKKVFGEVVVLKYRYVDFTTATRQVSLPAPVSKYEDIYPEAQSLWDTYGDISRGVRLLGVTLGRLSQSEYENVKLPIERYRQTHSDS